MTFSRRFLKWTGLEGADGILSLTVLMALVLTIKLAMAPAPGWVEVLPLALPLLAAAHKRTIRHKEKSLVSSADLQQLREDLESHRESTQRLEQTVNETRLAVDPEKIGKLVKSVAELQESEALRRLKTGGR